MIDYQFVIDYAATCFPSYKTEYFNRDTILQVRVDPETAVKTSDYYLAFSQKKFNPMYIRFRDHKIIEIYEPIETPKNCGYLIFPGSSYQSIDLNEVVSHTYHTLSYDAPNKILPKWFYDKYEMVGVRFNSSGEIDKVFGGLFKKQVPSKFNSDYVCFYFDPDKLEKPLSALITIPNFIQKS
jgi:hypothetical protein